MRSYSCTPLVLSLLCGVSHANVLKNINCNKYSDYYHQAGVKYNLAPALLKSVCTLESDENPLARNDANRDKSIDIGACQINSFWFDMFQNEFKVPLNQLYKAKTSIFAAAYIITYNFNLYGRNDNALGGYKVGWKKQHQSIRFNYASEIKELRTQIELQCVNYRPKV